MALMAPDLVSWPFTACEKFILNVDEQFYNIWMEKSLEGEMEEKEETPVDGKDMDLFGEENIEELW